MSTVSGEDRVVRPPWSFPASSRLAAGSMPPDDGLPALTESECLELLAGAGIGRVGVTLDALPAILPVNYRLIDGSIVFRTGPGAKLRAALNRTVVAFEVDHIDPAPPGGWSVLVVGVAEELGPEKSAGLGPPPTPWVSGDRSHTIRVRPEVITGRRIASARRLTGRTLTRLPEEHPPTT